MTLETLNTAIAEARRFIVRAEAAKCRIQKDEYWAMGCAETATAKRSSMDLTRALAELRKGGWSRD